MSKSKELHEQAYKNTFIIHWDDKDDKHEVAMVALIKAWERYAEAHKERFGTPVGQDCVTGEHWADIGKALIGLLSSETGNRLDCGYLDGQIRATLHHNGRSEDTDV